MRTMTKTITRGAIAIALAVLLALFCGFSQGVTSYFMGSSAFAVEPAAETPGDGGGTAPGTNPGGDSGGTNPGTNPGGGTTPGGGSGDSGGGTTPVDPQPEPSDSYYAESVMIEYDEPDDFGRWHFLDEPWEDEAYRPLTILKKGKTVQLNGWYVDNHGNQFEAANATTQLGEVALRWEIVAHHPDDPAQADGIVAKVDPNGKVTPLSNGSVDVRCTIADPSKYKGAAPSKTVTIVFDGQNGEFVKQVDILDSEGNVIGERWGGVTIFTDENSYSNLYVRVTWVDADENVIREESTYDGDQISTTITWNIGGSTEPFSINEETGRLRTSSYSGNAYVICKAVGGVGGAEIKDTANIQLDTGQYHYNPSDSLTLRVAYENRPGEIMFEKTYSYNELLGMLGSQMHHYTLMSGTKYGVISAQGWLFKDLVKLIERDARDSYANMEIHDEDIARFTFGTNDGYDNPVSYSMLFHVDRYYFPNYELSGSKQGATVVPPMLAFRSNQTWGESEANPTKELDEGMRFRLVFGCLWDCTMNSAYQIYYINTITMLIEGGPDTGGGGDGTGGDGDGEGKSSGDGSDRTAGDQSTAGVSPDPSTSSAQETTGAGGESGGTDAKQWRIYQMMSKNDSDLGEWDFDNPLSPFAVPGAIAALLAGGAAAYISFRRRLS